MKEPKRILVLFGGCSSEHAISLQSAHAVLTHMDRSRYVPLAVGITRTGCWLYYPGDLARIADGTWASTGEGIACTLCLDRGSRKLLLLDGTERELPFDAAFPVLHGKNGEDGTLQGALELAGIPVIGCGTLASALCMDKDRAHRLAAAAGVQVPQSRVLRREEAAGELEQAAEEVGYPLFVKPVRSGSSFGVTRVEGPSQLAEAAKQALEQDDALLLEEAIPGFEVGCAVLGNEELTVGLVDEIELKGGLFDYEEKYTLKTAAIHCPARIAPALARKVQETAKQLYRALGCRGMARVDLFLTPEGELVFNEINTIPGFTAHSRYPAMMQGVGIGFPDLVSRLIELGVEA